MMVRTMFNPTNKELAEALEEKFNIPVHYGFNEDIKDYEFFVYLPRELDTKENCLWRQTIYIFYVSVNREDLQETAIYEALRRLKMGVRTVTYDRVQLSNKDVAADIVTFECVRSERFGGKLG